MAMPEISPSNQEFGRIRPSEPSVQTAGPGYPL
jgi:hypothetical protein